MTHCTLKNGMKLLIRNAEEYDALEIVDMFKQMGGESENLTYGNNDYYFNEGQEKLFIRTMKERKNSIFIIAIIEGKIVGNLSFGTMQRGRLMHRGDMGISVLKEYWGLGIGSALLDYLLKWAEGGGVIKKIELQVRIDNKWAVELYLKRGFVIEGIITMGICVDDKYYDLYFMGKTIGV